MLKNFLNLFLTALLFLPCINRAGTYYVDQNHPQANNTNPGTLNLPWLTIQHAAETMMAGDSVFIRSGIYDEQVNTVRNGNPTDGEIVFSAYPGETPAIDGTGVTTGNTGIIIAHSYIKLLGLEIRNWNENGIWIENAAFLEISDCVVHHVFYGIGIADGSHDFVFNRVEAHHFD
ncbi:MAG: hypothetical protein GWN00_10815, partial [Aliifodinibius sp.]|nr:hypothetical protein [Fodinibius sp.]NIV11662.1 hypothetical protein [Fodinibius sp.]NIY25278.1 hypothetical protein [Fodinibius sp.]